ncbi:hypothetical protein [Rufibacter latericius]|uniref:Uncharacterized protein n=1 Tax=Rufibacter latericius TaxID=2487040 RepID=A0A3M9MJI9_9BACT|nr:hypothetical protein [Rufibacter latericius]RNI25674.1 hypothetical protein EFB08_12510 [Rufibacter latericius]
MKANYLFLAQLGFAALSILCLALLLAGTRHTFLRMGFSTAQASKKTWIIGGLLTGWLLLVSFLALSGLTSNFDIAPLNMAPALLPPLVAVLMITFHPGTQNFLRHLPPAGLLYLQAFRIPVEIFLWWLFLANAIPERLTFEGRNWDILSGLFGPVFAVLCYAGHRYNPKLAMLYHLLGLGLLLNIVANGLLTLPTPVQVFFDKPGATILTTFPVMLLPAFLVPLAYTLHFFSLRQAALERKETAPHQPKTVTA